MLFIPFPFVVTILLVVLCFAVAWRDHEAPLNIPFLALIMLGAVQSFLSGLRWGYGVDNVRYIAPVLAAFIPVLAYAGVLRLIKHPKGSFVRQVWMSAVPALVILCLSVFWRDMIDLALVLIFVGYSVAILLLMRSGTDALRLAPFEGAMTAYRAILFAAGFLISTAILDIFVALNFAWARSENAISVITAGNLGGLFFLSIAAAFASRSHMPVDVSDSGPTPETREDNEVLAVVKTIMTTKNVYRDPELNLDRLARKTGITARQISSAINRATSKNVSQYVNEYRISEACALLSETDTTVTEIMFDVGFQTKSNFNREFRRVTDMSPLQWRETKGRRL